MSPRRPAACAGRRDLPITWSVGESASPVAPQDAEQLLESSWGRRGAPLPRREWAVELLLTAALLATCWALVSRLSGDWTPDPMLLPVLIAYAASVRVAFPVGAGFAAPTQLFLVPLFA